MVAQSFIQLQLKFSCEALSAERMCFYPIMQIILPLKIIFHLPLVSLNWFLKDRVLLV